MAANALMAAPLIPTIKPARKTTPTISAGHGRLLIQAQQQKPQIIKWASSIKIPASLRNGCLIALNTTMLAMPALAEEVEKAKLFDFNLTLPIIAGEFLLLMVALDAIWFKPIGKFMDDRDEAIRQKLLSVRDNSEEIKKLQEEADAVLKAARAEVSAKLNQMKKEMSVELDAKLRESRARVEKELALALEKLEAQKQETLQRLDNQIDALSEEIVQKVLPFKI